MLKKVINILAILILLIPINNNNLYSQYKIYKNKIIKVGFYDYNPYFYKYKGYETGYYNDILDTICKDLGIEYEYIYTSASEAMSMLKNGDIDLLIGINKTQDRVNQFEFTNNYINLETYGVYTNKSITYGDLKSLNNLKFGYIPGEVNSKWIMDLLEYRDIKVIPIKAKSYKELNDLLIKNKIDATISNINNSKLKYMKEIFEYSTGPVYIVGNKKDRDLIKNIDKQLELYSNQEYDPIDKFRARYFGKGNNIFKSYFVLTVAISLSIFVLCIYFFYKRKLPYIKKNKMKKLIKEDLNKNKYFLYYQPIINPKKNSIIGFEGLLRLKKDNQILTPNYFIKDIENNDMLFETSLHILKIAINDYYTIKNYDNMKNCEFYVSLNMSLNEIENDTFIKRICDIAVSMNMKKHSVCIEILEKVGINNLNKINKSIEKLKKYGFMIAIDDFGVEYSNLDILEKLDFDVVKIDKYFIEELESSTFIKEIITFLSNICKARNKSLICEGVEYKFQNDFIKNIKNEKIYIQGYYYFKPLSIDEINKININ